MKIIVRAAAVKCIKFSLELIFSFLKYTNFQQIKNVTKKTEHFNISFESSTLEEFIAHPKN